MSSSDLNQADKPAEQSLPGPLDSLVDLEAGQDISTEKVDESGPAAKKSLWKGAIGKAKVIGKLQLAAQHPRERIGDEEQEVIKPRKTSSLSILLPARRFTSSASLRSEETSSIGDRKTSVETSSMHESQSFWSGLTSAMQAKSSPIEMTGIVCGYSEESRKNNELLRRLRLIHPHRPGKIRWNLFLAVVIILSTTYIPYRLAFPEDVNPHFDQAFEVFCSVIFCVDIMLTFNTAVFNEKQGIMVVDRTQIALRYLRFWFWIDLLSSFPFDLIITAATGKSNLFYLALFRMLRLSKLGSLSLALGDWKFKGIFFIFFQMVFIAHTTSCFWYYYGNTSKYKNPDTSADFPNTWVDAFIPTSYGTYDKYVASIYWTLFTLLGVGYGDIHAVNSGERIYTLAVGAMGAVFLGVVLAQVNAFISATNAKNIAKNARMSGFLAYIASSKKMSRELRRKAIDSYAYFLDQRADVELADSLPGIPKLLLGNLITNLYGSTIKRLKFFDQIQSDRDFIIAFIVNSKPFMAAKNELVFGKGDIADELVFVLHGSVQLWTDKVGPESGRVVEGYSTQGYYFGDFEYYKKTTRMANYSAFVNSEFLGLSYTKLRKLSEKHPMVAAIFKRAMRERYSAFLLAIGRSNLRMLRENTYSRDKLWFDGELKASSYVDDTDYTQSVSECFSVIVSIAKDNSGSEMLIVVSETSLQLIKRFIIFPTSPEKLVWDCFILLLILYIAFCVTVTIAFERESTSPWTAFNLLVVVAFFVDIVVNFLTAVKHENYSTHVAIHSYIAKKYLRTWFFIDVISALPFDYMFTASEIRQISLVKFVRLIRLFRLLRVLKLRSLFQVLSTRLQLGPSVVRGLSLAILVIFVGHFIACLWWYVSVSIPNKPSWIDNPAMVYSTTMRNAPLTDQYIVSLYWAGITLFGIGYGDILASNSDERLLNSIIMILGSTLLFSYILASVAEIVHGILNSRSQEGTRLLSTSDALTERKVPLDLKTSIMNFLKIQNKLKCVHEDRAFVRDLPSYIREEVLFVQNIKVLRKISIFNYISNRSVIIYLYNLFQVSYYDKNEYIFYEGELVSDVKFLIAGAVKLFKHKRGNEFDKPLLRRSLSKQRVQVVRTGHIAERRSLSTDHLLFDTDAIKIDHTAPEVDSYYFVKNVAVGEVLDCAIRGGNRPHVFTAWSVYESCIYSLRLEAIEGFVKSFPTLAGTLQGAFQAALSAQAWQADRAATIARMKALSEDVKKINISHVSHAPKSFVLRVHTDPEAATDYPSEMVRSFAPTNQRWWYYSPSQKVGEIEEADEDVLVKNHEYEQAPVIHADTIMEELMAKSALKRTHSFQHLPLNLLYDRKLLPRTKLRTRSRSLSGTVLTSAAKNREKSADRDWLDRSAANFLKKFP